MKSYEFGTRFRLHYTKFFPANYNNNFAFIQSTDTDRTHMTASAFLAGAFPPSGKEIWNNNLEWIPIPIHSIPQNEDNVRTYLFLCEILNRSIEIIVIMCIIFIL